jgi:exodeoxyribonuclease VII small subunit
MTQTPKQTTADPNAAADEPADFEALMDELEGIVDQLEKGALPLEQSLDAFERGMKVSKQAADILERAERRIEVLTGEPGDERTEPFDPGA